MSRFIPVLCCLLALLLAVPAIAQKDKSKKSKKEQKQEAIYDQVADETCTCMQTNDLTKMKAAEIEMQLGVCMIGSLSAHSKDLGEEINLSDGNAMNLLGEKIGLLMAVKCPQTLMSIATGMEGEEAVYEEMPEETAAWEGGEEVTGAIVRLADSGDVSYLILKDETGAEHELLWLRYFEGSESLLENPDASIGRKAMVYWVPLECYSPKTKDYTVRKEIRALTFVE